MSEPDDLLPLSALPKSETELPAIGDSLSEMICWGILARARLATGQAELAYQAAREVNSRSRQKFMRSHVILTGLAGAAEVLLELWERSGSINLANSASLESEAVFACRELRKYARIFPIGRPASRLVRRMSATVASCSSIVP